jgi:hypothetical protein
VDRLHQQAGSTNVVELHGHNRAVVCLHCKEEEDREHFQGRLERMNPTWVRHDPHALHVGTLPPLNKKPSQQPSDSKTHTSAEDELSARITKKISLALASSASNPNIRPDGDAEIGGGVDYSTFVVPACLHCLDGVLVPPRFFTWDR